MAQSRDNEQDEQIRRNSERITRSEAAIQRQTECLEKIRDHYFPKDTYWKRILKFCIKVIGAVTVGAGLLETWDWLWNARQIERTAEENVAVAHRLLFEENDAVGAIAFMDHAVELDADNVKYRMMRTYVKGLATAAEFVDLSRPLTDRERERVEAILAEAVFLQTQAPRDPMPYVLAAQANMLRGDSAKAVEAIEKAISLDPKNVMARTAYCAIALQQKDFAKVREQFAIAESLKPDFLLVRYWKAAIAFEIDHDWARGKALYEQITLEFPQQALPHVFLGHVLLSAQKPDIAAARSEFAAALRKKPNHKTATLWMGESYAREGNDRVARLWYDRAIAQDEHYSSALIARAKANDRLGDFKESLADWSAAIALDPFSEELLRERAKVYAKTGDKAAADRDIALADALKR